MGIHGHTSSSIIHTRIVANALSETSSRLTRFCISDFKISSRSEVELLARGLKYCVGSLESLSLVDIVLDVEDKTGFLDPILLALAPEPCESRSTWSFFTLSCVENALNGASVVTPEALCAPFLLKNQSKCPGVRFFAYTI